MPNSRQKLIFNLSLLVFLLGAVQGFALVQYCVKPSYSVKGVCEPDPNPGPEERDDRYHRWDWKKYLLYPDATKRGVYWAQCPHEMPVTSQTCVIERRYLSTGWLHYLLQEEPAVQSNVWKQLYETSKERIQAIERKLSIGTGDAQVLRIELEREQGRLSNAKENWKNWYATWESLGDFLKDKVMDEDILYEIDSLPPNEAMQEAVDKIHTIFSAHARPRTSRCPLYLHKALGQRDCPIPGDA